MPRRSPRKVEIDTVSKIVKFIQSFDAFFAIPVWFMCLYFTSFHSLWLMIPVTSLIGLHLYDTVDGFRWALNMAKSLASDAMAHASDLVEQRLLPSLEAWLRSGSSARVRRPGAGRRARDRSPARQPAGASSPVRQSGAGRQARGISPGRKPAGGGALVAESFLPSMRYGSGNSVRKPAEGGARGRSPGRPPGSPNKVHSNPHGPRRSSRGR
jgi:hypothetical protein